MSRRKPSVDALYEMAMQRIGDLRTDAEHGRHSRPSIEEQPARPNLRVVTTPSANRAVRSR